MYVIYWIFYFKINRFFMIHKTLNAFILWSIFPNGRPHLYVFPLKKISWTFWIFIHQYFSLFVWTSEFVQWNKIWKIWSFSFFCKYTKEYNNPIISWIDISSFFLLWMINRFAIDFNRHRDKIDSKLLLEIAILLRSFESFQMLSSESLLLSIQG